MSLWRHLTRGLRVITNRAAADRDLDEEVAHYFDAAAADLRSKGLSREAARRAARLELGNALLVREEVRVGGWENIVATLLADLRYGARQLLRNPGFAAVGVLTLALGIGASTAIFSAVNPILFEPLPYPHPSRIVTIWDHAIGGGRIEITFGTARELAQRSRSLEANAAIKAWQPTMTGPTEPERLDGQRVGAGYFRVVGVRPALGRDFDESEDRARGPNVVILGDGLWRRRFGADPAIVGRQITLDASGYLVIGVMPGGFENVLAPSAEVWAPLQYDASLPLSGREWGHHLRMVARLTPDVTVERAAREIDVIAHAPVREFPRPPWASLSQGLIVNALQDDVTSGVRPALVAVLGAVLLVLIIAGVNVTNLLLGRGTQRRSEFALRAALGAGRWRMMRQVLAESLLLAGLGGALGLILARLGVSALVAVSPPGLPRVDAIRVDGAVFAFGIGLTTLIGIAFGSIPGLQASRDDVRTALQQGARQTAGGHHATRRMLVVAEVALALVLLVSAGLLMRSMQRLFAVAPGFDPQHLITMQVQTSGRQFAGAGAVHRFFDRALDEVRRVPGVTAAAWTSQLPLSGDVEKYGLQFEANAAPDQPDEDHSALRYAVSPGYFEAIGIPLRRGRVLDARDAANAPLSAVINESLAARKFPGRDPIGQRVRVGGDERSWYTIVGVVGDVKHTSLALSQPDAAYTTTAQWGRLDNPLSLVVRARGEAAALAPVIRRAIWSVDKDQPIVRVVTMDALVAATAAERRFVLILFEAFAFVALALAAIGIYGVLAGSVTERTREIGVRSALGASRGDIIGLVLRQGMTLAGLGVAAGVIGAALASGALMTLLFGVSRLDPITYGGVIALLVGVSAIASWIPAWRAARVDPSITLRAE